MRIRRLLCVGLGLGILPAMLSAQATGDQARLTLGISVGAVAGHHLWSAGPQAVQLIAQPDTFDLDRRIRSTLAIGFGGTYFSGDNFGLTAEGFLVGLGFEDSCTHVFSSGSPDAIAGCQAIQGGTKAATAVVLSVGPILRFNSRKLFSPYGRANLGLVFSNQSPIRTVGTYATPDGLTDLVVYADDRNSRVEPALALGVGFTAAIAKGYNLRWELRDNIVGVQRVTGTIPQAGQVPPHERSFQHLFSMTFGFDVVLERRRGRRY